MDLEDAQEFNGQPRDAVSEKFADYSNSSFRNWVMNGGMLSTVMLMFFFLYVPGLSMVLGQVPLRLVIFRHFIDLIPLL